MRERPILFSGPMVRAIIDGRKTMTRRVVARVPKKAADPRFAESFIFRRDHLYLRCPYGQLGDRLWVRESWANINKPGVAPEIIYRADYDDHALAEYGNDGGRWRPSIHMPRWASRITLEVTSVRVERLQEITAEDAIAEGIEIVGGEYSVNPYRNYLKGTPGEMNTHCSSPVRSLQTLWDSINGKKHPWASNPWVWVIQFRRW